MRNHACTRKPMCSNYWSHLTWISGRKDVSGGAAASNSSRSVAKCLFLSVSPQMPAQYFPPWPNIQTIYAFRDSWEEKPSRKLKSLVKSIEWNDPIGHPKGPGKQRSSYPNKDWYIAIIYHVLVDPSWKVVRSLSGAITFLRRAGGQQKWIRQIAEYRTDQVVQPISWHHPLRRKDEKWQ